MFARRQLCHHQHCRFHPSGDPSPSAEDAALTRLMVEAGKLLGVEMLDHIVIARRGFVSLRDRKMGFP